MKRIKPIIAALLAASVCLALSGCRLALEDSSQPRDRFVGFSVLLGDIFDDDPSFDRGVPHEIDGQPLIVFMREENGETFVSSDAGEWFSDVNMHIKSTDEGEEHIIGSTLFVCDELIAPDAMLRAEHVYQRPDGTLYAVSGGSNYSGHLSGLEIKVTESSTVTGPEGEKTSVSTQVTLTVSAEKPLASARLIEMTNAGEQLAVHPLGGEEYEIYVSPDAGWALLEETMADGSFRYTAVNTPLDGQNIVIHIPTENGVCIPRGYTLRVPETTAPEKNIPA